MREQESVKAAARKKGEKRMTETERKQENDGIMI